MIRMIRPWRATDPRDVTLLEIPGRAGKLITADGQVKSHQMYLWHRPHAVHVESFDDLAELVEWLQTQRTLLVIRGRLKHPTSGEVVRRHVGENAPFEPCPRSWLAIDIDAVGAPRGFDPTDPEQAGAAARRLLPEPLRSARCAATLTGSAGIKPGLRCRLWFMLDRPLTDPQLKQWLGDVAGVDLAIYSATQPTYTAAPEIAEGAVDRCPNGRLAVLLGHELAAVPPLPEPPPRPVITTSRPFVGGSATAERYADACLRRLARASPGERHPAAVSISCRLLALAKNGLLDRDTTAARIKAVFASLIGDEPGRDALAEADALLSWAWQTVEPEDLHHDR